jgi:hypothetical protein
MKTFSVLLSLCLMGVLAHAAAPAKKTKVYILAGQSNMEGKGDFTKLTEEERAALERTKAHIKFAFNHEPIGPLRPRLGSPATLKKFGVDQMFGPEIFFGLRLAEVWPDQDMIFIKRAVGATSLYGRWNPDWSFEKAKLMGEEKAEPLYADLIAYAKEVLAGYPPGLYEICGMLWVQGESDGNASVRGPKPGAEYGKNLKNLITRVRRDVDAPDLPFIMMQVGAPPVVAGMKAAAKDLPNVTFIPQAPRNDQDAPNFLPQYPAGHYNYEGMKRIGIFMADAYLQNYTKIVPPASVVAPPPTPEQVPLF